MKLSARNVLKGKIVEVKKGQTTAHVRIDIGGFGCYGLDHQRSRRRAQAGQRPIRLCGHQGLRRDDRDRLTTHTR
jgi:hypothetical protein